MPGGILVALREGGLCGHTARMSVLGAHDELLIRLSQFRITQQEEARVLLRERPGLTQQAHIRLFEQTIPFFAIADLAARHQVLPCALPPARAWDDMIERQVTGVLAAILAGFIIAQQDV